MSVETKVMSGAAEWHRWRTEGQAAGMTLAALLAAALYIEKTEAEGTREGADLRTAVLDAMVACGALHVSPLVRIA